MNLIWPVWLDDIWAKSPVGDEKTGETLACHTWRVLERLKDMASLRPGLPRVAGIERLWHCLFWACWLHDLGKAADGFQAVLHSREGVTWNHRHEVLSLAFLDWVRDGLSREEVDWVTAAIIFHHRDPEEINRRYPKPFSGDSSVDQLSGLCCVSKRVLEGLWRWIDACAGSWIEELGLSQFGVATLSLVPLDEAVDGFTQGFVTRLRKRLDSVRRWGYKYFLQREVKEALGSIIVRGHVASCDHLASAHTGKLHPPSAVPEHLLAQWNMAEDKLFPHQRACMGLQGSAIMVAPTGSGKTEAALLWASSQQTNGGPVPRILYTLPYQASMNAMYDRLRRSSYPGQVGLEHGRSLLALYQRFLDEELPRDQAARAAHLARDLARLHHQPVRVLSPYQLLKAFFRLSGYEGLLSDVVGAAFIFDEIHAYEPCRLAMILASMRYLRTHLDARFLVMSATLPSIVRDRLAEALGQYSFVEASDDTFSQFQRHRVYLAKGEVTDDLWIQRVADEARNGSSVLVCCNTVARAQTVYEKLKGKLDETSTQLMLLHGRFNGRDRTSKESVIQELIGSSSERRAPLILVSTQVVEVSLDVDFDVLYTDPAPMEALIQRFGRVNRRRRHSLAPVWVFTNPQDGQGIYEAGHVAAALRILARADGNVVREDTISSWLDEVYSGELAEAWLSAYRRSEKDFETTCIRGLRGFEADENLESMFYQAFDSVEVLPKCFEQEYRSLCEDGYLLEASGLCVSVPWRLALRLGARTHASTGRHWPQVIDASYSSERGLVLQSNR